MPELKARKQIRLKDYDYSINGYYFITICSHNRENIFGELTVGAGLASARKQNATDRNEIKLSKIGQIINKQWNEIPNQYDNIKLDYYIIMPNHIHGILVIHNQMNREGTSNKEQGKGSTQGPPLRYRILFVHLNQNVQLNMSNTLNKTI